MLTSIVIRLVIFASVVLPIFFCNRGGWGGDGDDADDYLAERKDDVHVADDVDGDDEERHKDDDDNNYDEASHNENVAASCCCCYR